MDRRSLFPFMAAFGGAAAVAPTLLRLEPAPALVRATELPKITYRNSSVWNDDQGNVTHVPLSASHIDQNFWILDRRLETIEKALGLTIVPGV